MALAGSNGGSWSTTYTPDSSTRPLTGENRVPSSSNDAGIAMLRELHGGPSDKGDTHRGFASADWHSYLSTFFFVFCQGSQLLQTVHHQQASGLPSGKAHGSFSNFVWRCRFTTWNRQKRKEMGSLSRQNDCRRGKMRNVEWNYVMIDWSWSKQSYFMICYVTITFDQSILFLDLSFSKFLAILCFEYFVSVFQSYKCLSRARMLRLIVVEMPILR